MIVRTTTKVKKKPRSEASSASSPQNGGDYSRHMHSPPCPSRHGGPHVVMTGLHVGNVKVTSEMDRSDWVAALGMSNLAC